MNKSSKRCGKSKCKYYDKHNSISGCKIYEDRNECSMSLSHKKKVSNTSKKRGNTQNLSGI